MDICLYISDQHSYEVQGYAGDPCVRTPNLDRIAREGTAFDSAYSAYPVCVPSRMAMMSGLHASSNGAMSNLSALDSNIPTFAHALDIAGYETVLCGRMHFVGPDQRHGFRQRIAADITQAFHNRPARIAEERGAHNKTPQGGPNSVSLVGGGNSPSLEFDRYVVNNALDYLSQDHDAPQFLCVGTYAPHHPYVAPVDLYNYYLDKVDVPSETVDAPRHPALRAVFRDPSPDLARAVRAAYRGAVEFEDGLIGEVYDAFNAYLERTGHEGVFIYVSDHGDMEGYRGYYGKDTFYESSVHVPMLFAGTGVCAGARKRGAVSLLDIAPTVIELADAPDLPHYDGVSLVPELAGEKDDVERIVCSELGGNMVFTDRFRYGQMAVSGGKKLIHYHDYDEYDTLSDLANDPLELRDASGEYPEDVKRLRASFDEQLPVDVGAMEKQAAREATWFSLLQKCDLDSEDLWHCTPAAREEPNPVVRGTRTTEEWLRELLEDKEA